MCRRPPPKPEKRTLFAFNDEIVTKFHRDLNNKNRKK